MILHNIYPKEVLEQRIKKEKLKRINLSFYRYISIHEPEKLRDNLYLKLDELKVLGRIYIAEEGINAQLSLPKIYYKKFVEAINSFEYLRDVYLNISARGKSSSFLKLKIKQRKKIVSDNFPNIIKKDLFQSKRQLNNEYLSSMEFNKALEEKDSIVVDLRNCYETEVGHFKNAICLNTSTFREGCSLLPKILHGKQKNKILLYCTGGIRCEKAGVYLQQIGFENVQQLKGGIVTYLNEVDQKGLESKFMGKNFVFDQRLGEKISDDVISNCHQCKTPSDTHTNCENQACHLLFIQCNLCKDKYNGCCSKKCKDTLSLPLEQQMAIRKGKRKHQGARHYSKLKFLE